MSANPKARLRLKYGCLDDPLQQRNLRARFAASGFTRDLEAAYRQMWRRWCDQQSDPATPPGVRIDAVTTATESNRQRPSQRDCTTLVVLGAFSSGTTALTGYLERLGAYSCPPHLQLNDPMTPSSYEPTALRAALLEAVDEQQLCRRAQRGEGFADWFQSWWQDQCAQARSNASTQLVLKHPLLAFVINSGDSAAWQGRVL
ncbi:hypothetical protein [Thiorhodovibrio frisius]|uniref:hypothetical protein n=1 Tax=Thiorhodovibrio frisius TaxID=631362 RepID=UPI002B260719|nr:hypothetical protein [Thiorhodovibrio frisius]